MQTRRASAKTSEPALAFSSPPVPKAALSAGVVSRSLSAPKWLDNTPLTAEPGTMGQLVIFSRMMGRSIKPSPKPAPTCRGVRACSQYIFVSSAMSFTPYSPERQAEAVAAVLFIVAHRLQPKIAEAGAVYRFKEIHAARLG